MVAVTSEPGTGVLLRRAARMTARVKGELDVRPRHRRDGSQREDRRRLTGCGSWRRTSAPAGTS